MWPIRMQREMERKSDKTEKNITILMHFVLHLHRFFLVSSFIFCILRGFQTISMCSRRAFEQSSITFLVVFLLLNYIHSPTFRPRHNSHILPCLLFCDTIWLEYWNFVAVFPLLDFIFVSVWFLFEPFHLLLLHAIVVVASDEIARYFVSVFLSDLFFFHFSFLLWPFQFVFSSFKIFSSRFLAECVFFHWSKMQFYWIFFSSLLI